jgi:hypothetical protein
LIAAKGAEDLAIVGVKRTVEIDEQNLRALVSAVRRA